MLYKLLRTRTGQHLALKFSVALHKCGVFCLQIRHLFFECLHLVADKSQPLAHDGGGTVLGDESVEGVEKVHSVVLPTR